MAKEQQKPENVSDNTTLIPRDQLATYGASAFRSIFSVASSMGQAAFAARMAGSASSIRSLAQGAAGAELLVEQGTETGSTIAYRKAFPDASEENIAEAAASTRTGAAVIGTSALAINEVANHQAGTNALRRTATLFKGNRRAFAIAGLTAGATSLLGEAVEQTLQHGARQQFRTSLEEERAEKAQQSQEGSSR